jgi:hypothetical protein
MKLKLYDFVVHNSQTLKSELTSKKNVGRFKSDMVLFPLTSSYLVHTES